MGTLNHPLAGDTTGASLVETLVALSLLAAVVVPLFGALGTVVGRGLAERESEALILARWHMETLLGNTDEASVQDSTTTQGAWTIRRIVRREGRRLYLQVKVHHRQGVPAGMMLTTQRFVP